MQTVSEKTTIPIATGERLHTHHEFEMLLGRDAVDLIRPDVCLAGGLTHVKKIAGLAEAQYVPVVPHNPLSPVSTAVGLQLAACIPNFALQEYPYNPSTGVPGQDLVDQPVEYDDGYLVIPDRPGIGVELDEETIETKTYDPRELVTRVHEDGSVVDT
jgi:galactonate dehydratase